jgi:hypothetical protein
MDCGAAQVVAAAKSSSRFGCGRLIARIVAPRDAAAVFVIIADKLLGGAKPADLSLLRFLNTRG